MARTGARSVDLASFCVSARSVRPSDRGERHGRPSPFDSFDRDSRSGVCGDWCAPLALAFVDQLWPLT